MNHTQYFAKIQKIDQKKAEIRELEGLIQEFNLLIKALYSRIEILNREMKDMVDDQEGSVVSLRFSLNSFPQEKLMKLLDLTDDPTIIAMIQERIHKELK
jgi:hypothetical protein